MQTKWADMVPQLEHVNCNVSVIGSMQTQQSSSVRAGVMVRVAPRLSVRHLNSVETSVHWVISSEAILEQKKMCLHV